MGQSGEKGEPDPRAVAAVAEANRVQEGDEIVGETEEGGLIDPIPAVQGDLKAQLLQLTQTDPAFAKQLVEAAGLVVPAGKGAPSGEYHRDYQSEKPLHVMGGVEVAHPDGFLPKPPSFVKMYVRADGGEGGTDHASKLLEQKKRPIPLIDPTSGKPAVSPEGNPIYDEEVVDVIVDKGAKIGPDGKPVKTEMYKLFLDLKMAGGGRIDGDVISDAAAAANLPDGGAAVSLGLDGAPLTVGDAIGIEA